MQRSEIDPFTLQTMATGLVIGLGGSLAWFSGRVLDNEFLEVVGTLAAPTGALLFASALPVYIVTILIAGRPRSTHI